MTIAIRVARRFLAADFVTVFHGTNASHLSAIKSRGLVSPTGYSSGRWYMVAEDYDSARFHANNADDEGEINPIVIEFRVPTEPKILNNGSKKMMWDGFPYLWKPQVMSWEGHSTRWFALRQPLPPAFIQRVRHD